MVNDRKRVCHISTVHPAFDDRILYKECTSLADSGYDVFLIVQYSACEKINNINIVALNKPGNRFQRIFVTTLSAFRKAYSLKPDIIHFHDPELIFAGIMFRILGKKVIYDVHEDLPKQIRYKEWLGISFARTIFSFLACLAEHSASLFFNRIIAATPDIGRKFSSSKTILLRNYPRTDLINKTIPVRTDKKFPVVIYAGLLSSDRGILELVNAIELTPAELWLIGKWDDERFMQECMKCGGWAKTRYLGHMKLEEVYSHLKVADIGVATLHPLKNYITSLPVKAFEYMAAGIPMILSGFKYWREIFKEAAIFADPYSSVDIAEKINYVLENRIISDELISVSKKAVEREFSWEIEFQKLIKVYDEILS